MKAHKITIFVLILSLCANFIALSSEKTDMHVHCVSLKNILHICDNIETSPDIQCVKAETTKTELVYVELHSDVIQETEQDVPEKYENIIVKPKNRVQEPRRIVDEDFANICSISC